MRQIFIPYSDVPQWIISLHSLNSKDEIDILVWLGFVNQQLGNKANAKEIVSVSFLEMYYDSFTNQVYDYQGYLITYLESDMIANKDDLESAWNDGFDSSKDYVVGINFNNWFEENFE